MNNLYFFFFLISALFWSYRSLRALVSLKSIPQITTHQISHNESDKISVIIPAKNEEKNIRACVESLLNQSYANFEILVMNDNSTDQTENILKSIGTPYLNCPQTPQTGWTGKNFALHNAVSKTHGKWLLFTDADTRHEPQSLSAAMAYVQKHNLQFLSLLPRCIAESFWENLIQPFAMGYLGLWFPMEKVNNPKSDLYFANGQYLLIRRDLYEKIGGHEEVKGEFLEDFALMKKAKERKAKAHCILGATIYGTRMYNSLAQSWRGWRRIYLHAFRQNAVKLVLKGLNLFCFSFLPFILFIPLLNAFFTNPAAYGIALGLACLTLILILTSSWIAYGLVRAKRSFVGLHPLAAILMIGILFDAGKMAFRKQETKWR